MNIITIDSYNTPNGNRRFAIYHVNSGSRTLIYPDGSLGRVAAYLDAIRRAFPALEFDNNNFKFVGTAYKSPVEIYTID